MDQIADFFSDAVSLFIIILKIWVMRNLVFLILTMVLFACDPTVVFMEPQPEGKSDLKSFPAKYRGTYMELEDSSIFIITGSIILEKYEEDLAGPIGEIL